MPSTRLPGHALQSEGKPYELGAMDQERWIRSYEGSGGVALCECGAVSGWLTSDAARKRWHRDVHKAGVRAAPGSKEGSGVTELHKTSVETEPGRYRRVCTCGYAGMWSLGEPRADTGGRPCPEDRTVVALVTLQMLWGGLIRPQPADDYVVHLVRSVAAGGTPGPTLCGIDRFAPDAPGWSIGGGTSGPGIVHKPCPGCADFARENFPGLPVSGSVGGREMAEHLGVAHERR